MLKPIYMKINPFLFTLVFLSFLFSNAQKTFSSILLDQKTEKSIPFATIQFNSKNGVISNENGAFNITINRTITAKDSLQISCLGYESKQIALLNFNQEIIYLKPQTVDLDEVLITSKKYTVEEIIEKAKEGLATNYNTNYAKRKLFFRESYYTEMDKYDVAIEKSTIPEINQQLIDSLLLVVPKNSSSHTEILAELYGKIEANKGQKMNVLKSSRLYDKSTDINLDNYEKRFNDIFKKYVKRDSYFKIKSGWFSVKEDIDPTLFGDTLKPKKEEKLNDSLIAQKKMKDSLRRLNSLHWRKLMIHKFENNTFIDEDNPLNFIHKSNRYEFELKDYAFINDLLVYIINFEPKRREDFKGTLYINTEDFAIVRVDYKNVKPLSKFALLGISQNKYLKEGTIIFQMNEDKKYTLKYMDERRGEQVGVKRPIKIVEKNKNTKGRRKQNEVRGDIHFIVKNIEKTELVIFETAIISEVDFKNLKEKPYTKPKYLSQYDPEFWKGYNIIEPNEAIRSFKAIEKN